MYFKEFEAHFDDCYVVLGKINMHKMCVMLSSKNTNEYREKKAIGKMDK